MWKIVSQSWNGCILNSVIEINCPIIIQWVIKTNAMLFVYNKLDGHPRGGCWQSSSKRVKIHPSDDHAASYSQRGWDFIYLCFFISCIHIKCLWWEINQWGYCWLGCCRIGDCWVNNKLRFRCAGINTEFKNITAI